MPRRTRTTLDLADILLYTFHEQTLANFHAILEVTSLITLITLLTLMYQANSYATLEVPSTCVCICECICVYTCVCMCPSAYPCCQTSPVHTQPACDIRAWATHLEACWVLHDVSPALSKHVSCIHLLWTCLCVCHVFRKIPAK